MSHNTNDFVSLLAPKCWSAKASESEYSTFRCKGIPMNVAKRYLNHAKYVSCFETEGKVSLYFQQIQMNNFKITTSTAEKLALSSSDTKRQNLASLFDLMQL